MKKYIAEFLGTFALVFFGTGAVIVNDISNIGVLGIGISFGVVVMAMIYAFGEVSGAHINPAVTIAFAFSKKFNTKEVLPYITSQLLGAISASMLLQLLFPKHINYGATLPSTTVYGEHAVFQSFALEFILSFILMLVILKVSTGSKETGTMAAIAIGGTVLIEATIFGPVCGASMNPARSIAPAIVSGNFAYLWLYIIAPILGMLGAIFVCPFVTNKETKCC